VLLLAGVAVLIWMGRVFMRGRGTSQA
jgi:hypothetical protein